MATWMSVSREVRIRAVLIAVCLALAAASAWEVPAARAAPSGPAHSFNAGRGVNCSDFSNQAAAQRFFISAGGPAYDPYHLDADHDGIACESLPCPCSSSTVPPPTPTPTATPSSSPSASASPSASTTPSNSASATATATPTVVPSASPSPSTAAAMTMKHARKIYLENICASNAAETALDRAVFRGRDTVRSNQITPRWMRQINKALKLGSRADYESGRHLLHPPAAWPTGVASQVTKVAQTLIKSSEVLFNAQSVRPRRFVDHWNRNIAPAEARLTNLSRVARAVLDLPPPGHGCQ